MATEQTQTTDVRETTERWSVFKAGFASVADPKYVVEPQRERIERGERRGAARRVTS